MSKSNKHHTNWIKSPSVSYLQDLLKPVKNCPKRSCKGTCTSVLVRYYDHGIIHNEYECTTCGKIIKDYKAIEKDNSQQNTKRKGYKYANNSRTSRFRKNSSISKR
jgi:hypothetical protein